VHVQAEGDPRSHRRIAIEQFTECPIQRTKTRPVWGLPGVLADRRRSHVQMKSRLKGMGASFRQKWLGDAEERSKNCNDQRGHGRRLGHQASQAKRAARRNGYHLGRRTRINKVDAAEMGCLACTRDQDQEYASSAQPLLQRYVMCRKFFHGSATACANGRGPRNQFILALMRHFSHLS